MQWQVSQMNAYSLLLLKTGGIGSSYGASTFSAGLKSRKIGQIFQYRIAGELVLLILWRL